jgi:putative SOS response-associated peptidase YedK
MCGRFTQHYTWQQIHAFLSVLGPPQALNNIAPTALVDMIRYDAMGCLTARTGIRVPLGSAS